MSDHPTLKAQWQAGAFLTVHVGVAVVAVIQLVSAGYPAVLPAVLLLLTQVPAAYDVVTVIRPTENPEIAHARAIALARRAFISDVLPHATAIASLTVSIWQPNPEPFTTLAIAAWVTWTMRNFFGGWVPAALPGLPDPVVTAQPPGLDALLRTEFTADAGFLGMMPFGSILVLWLMPVDANTVVVSAVLAGSLIALAWCHLLFARRATRIVTGDVLDPAAVHAAVRSFVAARPAVLAVCAALALAVATGHEQVVLLSMITLLGGMMWGSLRLWQTLRIALGDHRSYRWHLAKSRVTNG